MPNAHQERRRRQRLCVRIRRLRRRKDRICGQITRLDDVLGEITDLARDVHEMLGDSETIALLTIDVRGALQGAIGRLEEVKQHTAIPKEVCDGLDRALKSAEDLLESSLPSPADPTAPRIGDRRPDRGGPDQQRHDNRA